MTCQAGANPVIEHWFGDCIYNARDMVGFILGLASIASWMVAQVPQLVANYRNKSADALSAFFLAEWLLGDTCNLLGALLKGDQLPTVVFTAQYFICMDVVLLVQYIYYTTLQRQRERSLARRHRHHRHHRHRHHHRRLAGEGGALEGRPLGGQQQQQQQQQHEEPGEDSSGGAAAGLAEAGVLVAGGASSSNGREFVFRPQRALACVGLLLLFMGGWGPQWQQQQLILQEQQQLAAGVQPGVLGGWRRRLEMVGSASSEVLTKMPSWSQEVGTVIAYCSSVLYLTSRVSQIYKNMKRRSAEGLALTMFLCAMAANTFYGLSIVVRAYSLADIMSSAPWLIGSLGTVALDTTIFMQGLVYGTHRKHGSDEEEQLLAEENKC